MAALIFFLALVIFFSVAFGFMTWIITQFVKFAIIIGILWVLYMISSKDEK